MRLENIRPVKSGLVLKISPQFENKFGIHMLCEPKIAEEHPGKGILENTRREQHKKTLGQCLTVFYVGQYGNGPIDAVYTQVIWIHKVKFYSITERENDIRNAITITRNSREARKSRNFWQDNSHNAILPFPCSSHHDDLNSSWNFENLSIIRKFRVPSYHLLPYTKERYLGTRKV